MLAVSADAINAPLRAGGRVVVATYGRAVVYGPRNAGDFTEGKVSGNLYVRRGRSRDCLTFKGGRELLVTIRLSI